MKITRPTDKSKSWLGLLAKANPWIACIYVLIGLFVVVGSCGLAYDYQSDGALSARVVQSLKKFAVDRGFNGVTLNSKPDSEALSMLPGRLPGLVRFTDVPHLVVDIKFKDFKRIARKRSEALSRGFLEQADDDFVPAKIRYDGRTVKVKLRLKGDLGDNFSHENKWSFRVHVKGKDHVMGLRRFSLQHPRVRGYHGEELVMETAKYLGAISSRYSFVDVTINGKNIGLMAVEEHFSKELLEANGRKESVIVKFDETTLWKTRQATVETGADFILSPFYSYKNTIVDSFGSSKVAESEQLSQDYATAVGLLRAFVNGSMSASEVFDVEMLGRCLAIAEFWGGHHVFNFRNLRFYYNPITARLEPIIFDSEIQTRSAVGGFIGGNWPLSKRMLQDSKVLAVYLQSLKMLGDGIKSGELLDRLKEVETVNFDILKGEFFLLDKFPEEELLYRAETALRLSRIPAEVFQKNQSLLGRRNDENVPVEAYFKLAPDAVKFRPYYPKLINPYLIEERESSYLEFSNAVPYDVEIRDVVWKTGRAEVPAVFSKSGVAVFPLRLKPTPFRGVPIPHRVSLSPPKNMLDPKLVVKAAIVDDERLYEQEAMPYFAPMANRPVPVSTVQEQLAQHPFLKFQNETNILSVDPGDWMVEGSLIIPEGVRLSIPPGTYLRFDEDAALISYGPVTLAGTRDEPIRLLGKSGEQESWKGIAVISAASSSQWDFAEVLNTSGLKFEGWQLTGGVTFYKSDVVMNDVLFRGNRAEDSLNIVHSRFTLERVNILDTLSDGFDSDFCEGSINGGLFADIGKAGGGDGVDFSGSNVSVTGVVFRNISDKAVSVGEKSTIRSSGVSIEDVGAGFVCKDGSELKVSHSTIRRASQAGLMAYIKKPEHGAARLEADHIVFEDVETRAIAQKKNVIILEGTKVATRKLDVKTLYKTVMKPGMR